MFLWAHKNIIAFWKLIGHHILLISEQSLRVIQYIILIRVENVL